MTLITTNNSTLCRNLKIGTFYGALQIILYLQGFVCISQDSQGYAVVTNNPQISGVYNNNIYFLLTLHIHRGSGAILLL